MSSTTTRSSRRCCSKEQAGASVTAVALDGEGVDQLLQSAIARGADRIVKISHDGLPPLPAAALIAALLTPAVGALSVDVVLTGVQTPEDVGGQLAAALGARLGWPHVSAVAGVQAGAEGLSVRQEHSGGYATRVLVQTPAVLGIQAASQPPRYVSGSKLRQAMGAKAETLVGGEHAAVPSRPCGRSPSPNGGRGGVVGRRRRSGRGPVPGACCVTAGCVKGEPMGMILVYVETRGATVRRSASSCWLPRAVWRRLPAARSRR